MHSIHAYILIAFFCNLPQLSLPMARKLHVRTDEKSAEPNQGWLAAGLLALRIFLNKTFLKSVGSIYGRSFGLSFTHCQSIWVDCGERYPWPLAGAPSLFRTTSGEST